MVDHPHMKNYLKHKIKRVYHNSFMISIKNFAYSVVDDSSNCHDINLEYL